MKKVEITETQAGNYNRMLHYLKRIAIEYETPERMRKNSRKEYGFDFEETIEMAYENIQSEAKSAIKGVKPL